MPDSLIAQRKSGHSQMRESLEDSGAKSLSIHPNPRMFNIYTSVLSKAQQEKDDKQISVMEERDSMRTFDERLNEVRGSMGDIVRNGSIISSESSPLLLRKYEDTAKPTTEQKTDLKKLGLPPRAVLAIAKHEQEPDTEDCYRNGRPIPSVYVNLEMGKTVTAQVGTISQLAKNAYFNNKSTPTEKCSFTPQINPINREGRSLQPTTMRAIPAKRPDFFSPLQKTGF